MKIKTAIIVLAALVVCASAMLLGGDLQNAQGAGVSTSDAGFIPPTWHSSGKTDPEAVENQPLMATGSDLKGTPIRFPAGQTPE